MTEVFKGATDQTFYFKLVDSAAGTPETGLTIANIDATYTRNRAAAVKNDLTALAAADSAHADNKGIEVDGTNAPGLYRVDFPDAAFASGADKVILTVTCSGCDPAYLHINLVNVNNQVAYVPNAAAEAAGGLPTLSAAQASDGTINVNVHRWLTATPNALQSGRVDSYLGAVANGVIAAASFAANALDAVWSTATRLLTAGTNIVLAKGTGVTGFNDLDAAGVRSAVGLASPNLDTQIDALPTNTELATALGTADDATLAAIATLQTTANAIDSKTTNLPSDPADQSLIIAATDSILSAVSALNNLSAAGVRAAIGMAAANFDTQVGDLPTNSELAAALAAADDATLAAIATLQNAAIAIEADTQDIQSRLPAALTGDGNMKSDALRINGSASAAANLAKTGAVIGRGTATTGATTTSIPTSAFTPNGAAADQFKGRIITFDADTTTAALRGQSTDITASSNAAAPTFTVTALTTAPASGDTFSVT